MILFRQKYPRWWFDWNLELARFTNRVVVYLALMNDHYPSTDEEQTVHLNITYSNTQTELNRWLPLVKWFLAIPHYVVLLFLNVAVLIVTIFA
jgi:roadblock/LC7 domain-containing protein